VSVCALASGVLRLLCVCCECVWSNDVCDGYMRCWDVSFMSCVCVCVSPPLFSSQTPPSPLSKFGTV